MIAVPDPLVVESGFPVFTDPGVCAVVKTTVQAVGFVGAGFLRRCGGNGRLCSRVPLATGGHLVMVRFRVRARAEGAEGSLEQADPGIRIMTELPASSALGEADTFLSRGNDKTVLAIHKGLPDEVLHRDHCGSRGCQTTSFPSPRYESFERDGVGDLRKDGSSCRGGIS